MIDTLFDLLLCGLIVAAALGEVASRQVFRATAFLIVYGVLVATAWVWLGTADVALAEVAVGAGLTGILVLRLRPAVLI